MPTTYAHDAFGRKVYHRLPVELQHIIEEHLQLYRIGLHGPDILFYHSLKKSRIPRMGSRLHQEIARPFFERGLARVRQEKDRALMAYLLGFACHFMLDSTCHPYIYSIKKKVSHTHIEKEMDRRWMVRDGLDPLHYFPAGGIHPSPGNAAVIQRMFPEISVRDIRKSLKGQRRITGGMVLGGGGRRWLVAAILRWTGEEDKYGDFFMKKEKDHSCEPYLKELDRLFVKALYETPGVLCAMYGCMREGGLLPSRFDRDYQ